MSDASRDRASRIERLDPESLTARIRQAAERAHPDRILDELELQHLVRVVTGCSLLLTDVYSEERLARIMHPERGFLTHLIDELIRQQRQGEGEVLYRVRRLPEQVRVVGDKALFDLGLLGLRQVKGYDLIELGARAYGMAGEVLELLAEDRQLSRFFKENRLLMLPLEEEVVFLRQCSDQFRLHAEILKRTADPDTDDAGAAPEIARSLVDLQSRVPLKAAAAEALREQPPPDSGEVVRITAAGDNDAYVDAARGDATGEATLSRDQLLSAYERMVLFSSLDIERLRAALDATVVDQPSAVATLCDEFSLFAAGTRDLRKPPAYFLVGPTGVGKNHLVESLRRALEGIWRIDLPMLTIEGPNYTYPSDINELRGATRGFIRSDEEGLLTAFHGQTSRAPVGILLIDEVEKAHSQLMTFFLSILDRGTTTDNRGSVLNFANCMLFFTSNLGYSDSQQGTGRIGYMDDEQRSREQDRDIRRDLRRALKPEFVNRVRLVHFERLGRASAERILDLELDRIARRYRDVHGLTIELAPSAREELIARGFSPEYGARRLASTLESVCNVEIAKRVRQDDGNPAGDRGALVDWLREVRAGKRAFQPDDLKRRVLELARARLDYDRLRVEFDGEVFRYEPHRTEPP